MRFDTKAQTGLTEKQGESELFTLFHSFPDAVFVMSPEGTLLDANDAFVSRFTSNREWVGINAYDFLPPELANERRKMVQEALLTAKPLTFDDEAAGQLLRSTIYPCKSPEGNIDRLLIIAQDISDIGQLLQKEQLVNRHIINSIPGTFYILDAKGKFVAWNDQVRDRSYGVAEDKMAETFGIEIFHPDDRGRATEALQNIITNDAEVIEEFRVIPRGGSGVEWRIMTGKRIMLDGAPHVIGVGIDITERKHAEEALTKSEDRFKTLFEEHPAVMITHDPVTGDIIDANQAAADFYGWSIDELRRMSIRQIDTMSSDAIQKEVDKWLSLKQRQMAFRHRRADGSIRDVEVFARKVMIKDRPLISAIIHDVTERIQAGRELQRLGRVLRTINCGNDALLHTDDETELLQKICNIIMDRGGYLMAWVGYASHDEAKSIYPVAQAGLTDNFLKTITMSWADNEYGQGPSSRAIRTGQHQHCRVKDIEQDQRFAVWMSVAKKLGCASIYSMPLKSGNSTIGVLSIYSERPDAFEKSEAELLGSLAENLSYGIVMVRSRITMLKSEQRFKTLFNSRSAIQLILDAKTGRVIDANKAASEFYGWSVADLKQMFIWGICTLPKEIIMNEMLAKKSDQTEKILVCHRLANGSSRDVEVFRNIIEIDGQEIIHAIIHDITEHNRLEIVNEFRVKLLKDADNYSVEELLRLTLDEAEKITGSSIGFAHFVDEDQTTLSLQSWSANTLQNMCKAEGKGEHYPLDKAGVWADAVRTKTAIIHNNYSSLEYRKGMPEGHAEIKREMVIPVIRNEKIVAIMGVGNKETNYDDHDVKWIEILANHVWDIVAKKIAVEEKKMLTVQLQQAMKMEMIGQLSAGIAHEINNPLNFITLNAHAILDDFNDLGALVNQYRQIIEKVEQIPAISEEVERLRKEESVQDIDELLRGIPEALAKLQSGIERISTITRSMRSYSFKNVSEQSFAFDLNKAIRDALVIAQHEYNTLASVVLHLEELPELFCDPAQINQVILNLIINSSHAIKSQNRSTPGKIEIKTWKSNESISCSVSDDGPGIPEKIINRIFEPFFTTKEPGKGTGLGLSISYDIIVNKHRGTLSVACLAEGGTAFTFTLPVTKAPGA